jgi:hypothetical protein
MGSLDEIKERTAHGSQRCGRAKARIAACMRCLCPPARWLDGRVGKVLRKRALRDRDETTALEAQGADRLLLEATQVSMHSVGSVEQAGAYSMRGAVEACGRGMATAQDVALDESQYTED